METVLGGFVLLTTALVIALITSLSMALSTVASALAILITALSPLCKFGCRGAKGGLTPMMFAPKVANDVAFWQ